MSATCNLERLYRGLEALYCSPTGINPRNHLVHAVYGARREAVFIRQADDGLEVGLMLDPSLLARFERHPPATALHDLGGSLPVIEGLSHLLYLAESARRERGVSALELETQAEVDKLAVHLLHQWPVDPGRFAALVDRLYYRFSLVPGMSHDLRARYRQANRIALGFSRRLKPHVDHQGLPGLRRALQEFWSGSMAQKRSLAA